ncbi:class I adenylate-forming enzyme family protein [Paracoccus sp. p3-h83]|uniref:class I adenylate-forming enzyme family protein n=1 Tax=Paracoccus sp. p3-h83 TaxID=3342805 RepID=UPI0035BADA97
MPLSRALPDHAATQGDAPALRLGDLALDRAGLHAAAGGVAGLVAGLPPRGGATPGWPLVALIAGNHPQAAVWITAALAHPFCIALLDPAWPSAQIAAVLARLRPDLVLVADERARDAATGHPTRDLRDPLPTPAPITSPLAPDDSPFFIGFTSGSTGLPKAFLRQRGQWRASLRAGHDHFGLTPATATLAPGPLAHGLTLYALAETLHAGAAFTGLTRFSPKAMARALTGQRRLVGVPTMMAALIAAHRATGATFPALTAITCAGARLDGALIAALAGPAPQARVTDYYGASELGFVTTATHPLGRADPALGCGRAFPGVDLAIRDGLVWVRSPLVLDGYLWGGDATGLRCDGDWRSVGDLGRLDAAGRLHLLGRADGMVVTGGRNIHPDAVAAGLRAADPTLAEVEVLPRPDAYLGQVLVAVILADTPPDPALLLAAAARHLPRHALPRAIWWAQALPRTSSGKTARATLAEWLDRADSHLTQIWPDADA